MWIVVTSKERRLCTVLPKSGKGEIVQEKIWYEMIEEAAGLDWLWEMPLQTYVDYHKDRSDGI